MPDKGRKIIEKKNEALQQLKIEYVPVASIHPNSYNPNRQSEHDFELLCKSIREDGFTQPIICHTDRTIIDGEHRWTALIVLRHLAKNHLPDTPDNLQWARENRIKILDQAQEIPVVFTTMTIEQMRIATLRHNRARGSEDIELTVQVLRELQALGAIDWEADSLMMSDEEINQLLANIPAPEALAGEEYGQAWEPTKIHPNEMNHDSPEARFIVNEGEGIAEVSAMTNEAIERQRERERAMRAAKTDEERIMAQKDNRIYRLALIYSGEEADEVRAALGTRPAERLLELCRAMKVA